MKIHRVGDNVERGDRVMVGQLVTLFTSLGD